MFGDTLWNLDSLASNMSPVLLSLYGELRGLKLLLLLLLFLLAVFCDYYQE